MKDKQEGKRFNTGKTKWSLLDFDSLKGIPLVVEIGMN